jgi:hypothetical protein
MFLKDGRSSEETAVWAWARGLKVVVTKENTKAPIRIARHIFVTSTGFFFISVLSIVNFL